MSEKKLGRGVIVPMVTPFRENGKIDLEATDKIINHLIFGGSAPFILGTTGESASIAETERSAFVETMVKAAAGRTFTYAGVSATSLQTSVEAARQYFDLGVDAVVAHPPSYYPLSDSQMLNYFEMLVESIPGPLIVYNITSVTHVSISLSVLDELSFHERIIGIKDSERDIDRLYQSLKKWADREDFAHLVGWGSQMANGLRRGSDGLVPSTGNITPKLYQDMMEAFESKNNQELDRLQILTDEVSAVYQKDRNLSQSLPALKVMMAAMNLCLPYVLPPLQRLGAEEERLISDKIKVLNLHSENSYK
jgi:4-hydroxy-tetrahydrodipicolinate synthase